MPPLAVIFAARHLHSHGIKEVKPRSRPEAQAASRFAIEGSASEYDSVPI